MIEFLGPPEQGRCYSHSRRVRLSDAGPDGRLRVDGLVRYLQDVASDDWSDAVPDAEGTWVVRQTAVRLAEAGWWPVLDAPVTLRTWCGGTGPAWAQRCTDLAVDGQVLLQATALWVPLAPSGRPVRLGPQFLAVYGEAAGGRRVSGRVSAPAPLADAPLRPWPVRRSDLDVVGHVNNAALWTAVTEVAEGAIASAVVTHYGPVDVGDPVMLAAVAGRLALSVGSEVRVGAEFSPA